METRLSPVMEEIKAIFTDGPKNVNWVWKCDFLTMGTKHDPMRTFNIDINRNYSENYADDIDIEIQMAPSQYLDYVYPNRQNLTVTLYQIPLNEDGTEDWTTTRYAQTYRGYVKGAKDIKLTPDREQGTSQDLDQGGPIVVPFQLSSKALEQLRLKIEGGNFRGKVPGMVLKAMFDNSAASMKVDGARVIDGVDMVPPDNLNTRDVMMVPHGKMLIELPSLFQEKLGGVYNSGIGFYLQDDHWYIWPKYATNRQEKAKQVLTIFDVPSNQFPGVERTYRETAGQVIMISTGKSSNHDDSETLDLNLGNGIRFTDANAMLDGYIHVEGNKAIARRGVASSEFVDAARDTGINFAPLAKDGITSNPFKMASRLAPRKGMVMQFTWENANPFLLYPGMQVKVFTPRDGKLEERTGVLSAAQYLISPKGKTNKNSQQVCVGHLAVFVSRATSVDKLPDIPT